MGRKILDFDGTVNPVTGTDPYGTIKDDPGGTKVNGKSNNDMQVFFQRIAANAGVALNSLPDNATNGFQFVQALNALINQEPAGMAAAFGAGTSSTTPIKMSGMVGTSGGGTLTITAGWFFYWGKYCYFPGNSCPDVGTARITITTATSDGLPIGTVSSTGPVTPDATHFDFGNMVAWSDAVGVTTIIANVATNTANIAANAAAIAALQPLPWTTTTLINSWVATGGMSTPRFTKNGLGKVSLQGSVAWAAGVTLAIFTNLPVGYRPSQDLYISTFGFQVGATPSQRPILIQIHTNGDVQVVSSTFSPATTSDFFVLDGINFDIL